MFVGKAYSRVSKNRQSWKALPGTNTVAYHLNSLTTDVESFIILAPGWDVAFVQVFLIVERIRCQPGVSVLKPFFSVTDVEAK